MLKMKSVTGGYGEKKVLRGVDLELRDNEILGLVGPNGSGKSTVLKAIFGMLKVDDGDILLNGEQIKNRSTSQNVLSGISYVPQGNRVFDKLTVQENIEMGGVLLKDSRVLRERIEQLYEQYPKLKPYRNKAARKLSGGERQMVGICMGLVMQPKILLIDEPSIGLAPRLVEQSMNMIKEIHEKNKVTVLMVEQNVHALLSVADRVYLLRQGNIVHEEKRVNENTIDHLRELFLQ